MIKMGNILIAMFGKNEELNIPYAIKISSITNDFIYIDSSENNKVLSILKSKKINYIKTKFFSWSQLRNVAYDYAKKQKYNWILILDADEYIVKSDWLQINKLELDLYDGYFCKFNFYYCQNKLRFCRHRPRIRLVSVNRSKFESNDHDEWVNCKKTHLLKNFRIINNDLTPFNDQILKQLIKAKSFSANKNFMNKEHSFIKTFILRRFYKPSIIKAFLYFSYHYFFKLGFFDGKAGFYYCFNYAFLYHLLAKGIDEFEK